MLNDGKIGPTLWWWWRWLVMVTMIDDYDGEYGEHWTYRGERWRWKQVHSRQERPAKPWKTHFFIFWGVLICFNLIASIIDNVCCFTSITVSVCSLTAATVPHTEDRYHFCLFSLGPFYTKSWLVWQSRCVETLLHQDQYDHRLQHDHHEYERLADSENVVVFEFWWF